MQRRLPSPSGPLARLFAALALLVAFATSLFLGAVLFLTILGLAVVLALLLYLRFWWLRRQWQRQTPPPPHDGDVLEGEYTVEGDKFARKD